MAVLRIWNLRRGDADDNRTSPHAHGMWSVIFSSVLEFNWLKASISFLALIIVPALLVGIAPSIVVTYGRLKLHITTLAGTRPIVALVLLAILIAAAFWIGRPLLALAFDHFWHLHYTLVFPVFVVLRELLRAVAERLLGRSTTPERLHRTRQLCAVFAALLLASGGIALATSVEFSIGLQLVNVAHVRPWAVARAALGNAAVILGLSASAASLYWLWRELKLSGPVRDWTPSPPKASSSTVRVAHLSDLHVVGERYGYRMETGTHGPRGNRSIRNALHKLATMHALSPLDRVVVTGDITDAGTRAEWAEFIDLLRCHPELRARISFVPGNHDVNVVDRTNTGRLDLPWSSSRSLRKLRVVLALDEIQGDRAHVVDRASGALGPSLKNYLREGKRVELLRSLAQNGSVRGRWEMAKIWDAIFPLVEPPLRDDGYGLILLDSNARSNIALTSAVGVVDPSQLSALKSVLRHYPRCAWLILLHHQVVEYPVPSISLRKRIGLALINGPDVLAVIAPHASRVVILHGHRHRDWIGTCGEVVLCSTPSVALGSYDGEKYHGSFHIHEFAFGAGGDIWLTFTERVQVG